MQVKSILSTFIKLSFVIKIFVLSIFDSGPFTQVLLYIFFKTNYRLMQIKSIAECSKGSILQYFRPS